VGACEVVGLAVLSHRGLRVRFRCVAEQSRPIAKEPQGRPLRSSDMAFGKNCRILARRQRQWDLPAFGMAS